MLNVKPPFFEIRRSSPSIRRTADPNFRENSQSFFQEQTTEIPPTISQLVSTMTQACELFEEISKRVMDPDVY